MKVVDFVPVKGGKVTQANLEEMKNAINTNADVLENKAPLEGGVVPLPNLPSIFFKGLTGEGTVAVPFELSGGSGGQASAEDYLKSLPGYEEGTEKILFGGNGFSWGPVPAGAQPPLGATTLSFGTPSVNSIPLSWTGVIDATRYVLQRADNNLFTGAVVAYNGPGLSFSESDLAPNATYYYRVRATASGFAAGDWSIINATTAASGNITPPAPTAGVINDTQDTFDWTNATGYSALSNYEYTLNGGTDYSPAIVKPISVGNVTKAAGQVGVRVKADTGRSFSATLFNVSAFNSVLTTPTAPTAGTVNDTEDTFDWTNTSGFVNVSDYEITVNGGTSWSQATEKPMYVGNVAKAIGSVGVRVRGVVGVNNPSAGLFNNVAFTVPMPASLPITAWGASEGLTFSGGNNVTSVGQGGTATHGWAVSPVKLPAGTTGFVMFDLIKPNELIGVVIGLSAGTQFETDGTMDYRMYMTPDNKLLGGKKGVYNVSPAAFAQTTQSKGRIRADGVNIIVEYTTNGGTTWTTLHTSAQPLVEMNVKLYANDIGYTANNIVQTDLFVS